MTRDDDQLGARLGELLDTPGAALLLDLDGTLVDSEPMMRAAFRSYFDERGWQVAEEHIAQFRGRPGLQSFEQLDGPWRGEEPADLVAGVVAAVDAEAHPPVPVPGAAQAIRHWHARGTRVALVTSAFREWAGAALELLGVADLGIEMITAEDTPIGKPAPDPFLLGARRLGVDIAASIVAEDSAAGITAARGAGVAFVLGVTTSLDAPGVLAAGADAATPDLRPLVPE